MWSATSWVLAELSQLFCDFQLSSRRSVMAVSVNSDLFQSLTAEDLDKPLTEFNILAIARRMLDWKAKAGVLGLREAEIENIEEDNSTNLSRKVALMKSWRDKYGDLATLENFLALAQRNGWTEFRDLGGSRNSNFEELGGLENSGGGLESSEGVENSESSESTDPEEEAHDTGMSFNYTGVLARPVGHR